MSTALQPRGSREGMRDSSDKRYERANQLDKTMCSAGEGAAGPRLGIERLCVCTKSQIFEQQVRETYSANPAVLPGPRRREKHG